MSLRDRLNKNIQNNPMLSQSNEISLESGAISEELQNLREALHLALIEKVNSTPTWVNYSDREQKELIRQFIDSQLKNNFSSIPINQSEKERIIKEILQETKGYGPLDTLLSDPSVSDILVNGPKSIYIEQGGKLIKTNVTFKDNSHLRNIIDRIVSQVGRRIDEKSPMVDARLPDGSRVNAIIPPLALDGPALSIRRFKTDVASIENLLEWGSMTVQMAETLKLAVKSRLNIIISGGTGAGKTTLLNSLSALIANDERIVTIEDSAELSLKQDHVVRLETRPPNIEGEGQVTARDLVINSLRMRPDRIIIGECRGAETLDMLQAMNTGHDGSLTTLHANNPRDALSRLETMVLYSGVDLPEKNIKSQICSAVDLIIQANRLSDGSRRVTHITEIIGMEGNVITMQEIFKWEQKGIGENARVIGSHVSTGIRPKFAEKLKTQGFDVKQEWFNINTPAQYLCKNPPNVEKIAQNTESSEQKPKSSSLKINTHHIQSSNPLLDRLKNKK